MRKWNDYKETMIVEPSVYQSARDGDIKEVLEGLSQLSSINEKNNKGHSLLMLAAYNNQLELTKILLEHGADVNSIDLSGNSILMGVAFKGYLSVCEVLIKNGADTTFKNSQGQQALDFAQMFGRADVTMMLSKINQKKYEPIKGFFKSWIGFTSNLGKGAH